MGHQLQDLLQIQRLVFLGGMVFAVFIMFQYFKFPYGDVMSSLFSATKIQITKNGSYPPEKSSLVPQILGNITGTNGANNTGPNDVLVNGIRSTYKGHDVGVGNDIGSERKGMLDDSTDLNGDGVSGNNAVAKQNLMSDKIEQNDSLAPEKTRESGSVFSRDNATHSTLWGKSSDAAHTMPMNTTLSAPPNLLGSKTSIPDRDASNSLQNLKENEASLGGLVPLANLSTVIEVPRKKGGRKKQKANVVSISEMHDILVHNWASSHSMKPRWSSTADQELLEAKSQVENAPIVENDDMLYPSVFRNISIFRRSYELMEKTLKVYIYKEGDKPIFNQPEAVIKGIYASEGWFMMQMKASKRFVTNKPKHAHLFYIPYSSKMLKATLSPNSNDRASVVPYLKNYLDMIMGRYNFWNRTAGADHFLVACHDWGPNETRQYMSTCIRALCNTDVVRSGFELGKDVSLPETNVRYPQNPLRELGGKPPAKRSVFAFFAGQMHGSLRAILLRHWENKDPDMKIFGKLPKVKDDRNYVDYMKSSKFCICAKGSEVNSPRVVEAIFYECVPVIISDNFVPPFFEFLDWESFAVFVHENNIPNLKTVLLSISNERYLEMHRRVKQVQQHFLWHVKPSKFDIFHMILHSIWYNRVSRVNPG